MNYFVGTDVIYVKILYMNTRCVNINQEVKELFIISLDESDIDKSKSKLIQNIPYNLKKKFTEYIETTGIGKEFLHMSIESIFREITVSDNVMILIINHNCLDKTEEFKKVVIGWIEKLNTNILKLN